jgi:hypothetical protein
MGETVHELARQNAAASLELSKAIHEEEWGVARSCSREILSVVSKLHQRLTVMAELAAEARWAAAVDRAVPKPAPQIEGQLTIADAIKASQAKADTPKKSPTPRKKG